MTNDLEKLINENPGYSQIANFIYALGLSKHALLVLHYLIRCANRRRGNKCFPSIKTIAKNCSIPSETTVREAIKELIRRGLITKDTTGRHNIYKIDDCIYLAIDKANKKDKDTRELEETPTYGDGIESEETENSTMETHSDAIPPECDEIPTYSDDKYQHHMVRNKTKETRLNNHTNKQEEQNSENTNFEGVNRDRNVSTRGKTNTYAEANRYYQSLTERGKDAFDIGALKLLRPDEANPQNGLASKRNIRRRMYELLQIKPIRLEGDEVFCVLPDEVIGFQVQEVY